MPPFWLFTTWAPGNPFLSSLGFSRWSGEAVYQTTVFTRLASILILRLDLGPLFCVPMVHHLVTTASLPSRHRKCSRPLKKECRLGNVFLKHGIYFFHAHLLAAPVATEHQLLRLCLQALFDATHQAGCFSTNGCSSCGVVPDPLGDISGGCGNSRHLFQRWNGWVGWKAWSSLCQRASKSLQATCGSQSKSTFLTALFGLP